MPLYEYICPNCSEEFEKIVSSDQVVQCPKCGREAKKKVSAFATGSCSAPPSSGFG